MQLVCMLTVCYELQQERLLAGKPDTASTHTDKFRGLACVLLLLVCVIVWLCVYVYN